MHSREAATTEELLVNWLSDVRESLVPNTIAASLPHRDLLRRLPMATECRVILSAAQRSHAKPGQNGPESAMGTGGGS